jgi:TRAP-type transport system periplasmic protein
MDRIIDSNYRAFINQKKEVVVMKRKLFLGLFVVLLALIMYSRGHAAEAIKLSFSTFLPPVHPIAVLEGQLCDEVKKRTNGRVEISYHTSGTLTGPTQIYNGIIQGISDMGMSAVGYTMGRFPLSELITLPLGFPSAWVSSKVAGDFYEKFKPKEYDKLHVLYLDGIGPFVIQTVKKPVKTMEDLKGLKLRGPGVIGDTVRHLGATPVPLEMGDVYEALRRGVLDGILGPMEMLSDWKVGELEKYVTASWKVGNSHVWYLAMNKEKWNSLPPDVQKVFTEVAAEVKEKIFVSRNQSDIRGRDFLKSQGGQIIELSDAESDRWIKAVQPMVASYKKELTTKGFATKEVDGYVSYIAERIQYWKKIEKEKGIPTPYNY